MGCDRASGDRVGRPVLEVVAAMAELAPVLLATAQRVLRSVEDAEDALQNAVVRFLGEAAGSGREQPSRAVLVTAVRREALMIARAARRRLERIAVAAPAELDSRKHAAELVAGLGDRVMAGILQELGTVARGWLLDELSGLTEAAIVERDGVTAAAVRQRRSRLESMVRDVPSRRGILDLSVTKRIERQSADVERDPQPPAPSPQPPAPPK